MSHQDEPHFGLLLTMHPMCSFSLGGAPRALKPYRILSVVGRRPVTSSTLFFASPIASRYWSGRGTFGCYSRTASYVCFSPRACNFVPSCRAGWSLTQYSSSNSKMVSRSTLPIDPGGPKAEPWCNYPMANYLSLQSNSTSSMDTLWHSVL